MKNFFSSMRSLLFLFLAVSCSSTSEECKTNNANNETIVLKSKITNDVFNNVVARIGEVDPITRSSSDLQVDEESEERYKQILTPFIEDGLRLKEEMMVSDELTDKDRTFLKSVSDEEYATLSLFCYAYNDALRQGGQMSARQVAGCLFISILGIGSGVYTIQNIAGYLTARTALQFLKAMAVRYAFGYIGLAVSIYSFVQCISNEDENRLLSSDDPEPVSDPTQGDSIKLEDHPTLIGSELPVLTYEYQQ
jgi:hypothetical protein